MRKRKGDKEMSEGLDIEGFVTAGTEPAHEALGPTGEHPYCVRCGSPIKYVFLTSKGPMGGDCLATLTGDTSTRRLARAVSKKLDLFKAWGKPLSALEVSSRGVVTAISIDRDDYDEWSGEFGEKRDYVASFKDLGMAEAVVSFEAEMRELEYRRPGRDSNPRFRG